jgi:hypothetical protein
MCRSRSAQYARVRVMHRADRGLHKRPHDHDPQAGDLMTVLPFVPSRDNQPQTRPGAAVRVTGTFDAPRGATGTFAGSYRLERLRSESGQLAAAGVLTGELVDADDTVVAVGSRRHTAAAELETGPAQHLVRIGPVDVNVAGLMVTVQEFVVVLERDLPVSP